MIELSDPAWDSLRSHCRTGKEIRAMLSEYESRGFPERDDLYEDLLDLGCGGQFYAAAYASAPHLVRLAQLAPPLKAAILLNTVAATIHFAGREGSDPVDESFRADFPKVSAEAWSIAQQVVDQVEDSMEARQLRLSMALFQGDESAYERGIEEI